MKSSKLSVETPEICKQVDKSPEIFDYNDLHAKFEIWNEIYELKLEINSFKQCTKNINSKSSPGKNYNQELIIKGTFKNLPV